MATDSFISDVVILGGGPAGATAAKLLAGWNRSVVVLTRPAGRSVELGESLPPSTRKILQHVGSYDAIARGDFVRTTGNTVWWGSTEGRVELFADGQHGYQVSKRQLEQVLLDVAADAGAEVHRDVVVHGVDVGDDDTAAIRGSRAGQAVTWSARWVVDATGRSGVVARQGWRRSIGATRTLALIGRWNRADGWELEHDSHTLVESYRGGWAWSLPVSPTQRYVTVMVDPRHTDVSSRRAIGHLYASELAETAHLHRLVEGAVLEGEPWACDASPYTADQFGAPGRLLAGDAGSFIDPLSSFGVKKALTSGWLAAVVANTGLEYRDRIAPALDLFDSRERAMFETSFQRSATFAEAVSDEHGHPFWTDRADAVEAGDPDRGDDIGRLKTDPDVLRAFEDLKQRESIDLTPGATTTIVPRPVVSGAYVELHDHLLMPDHDAIRFLREVDLPTLMRLADGHRQVPDLFDAYNRRRPPVPLPDFLGALSALIAWGGLVHRTPV